MIADGKRVFLDMKLLDIDNTVAKGVENIVKMNVSMLTLHAYPKAMRAAVEAARGSDLCLLGVTVLTSMDAQDFEEAGYSSDPQTLVARRAAQAAEAGMGGIVCSAAESQTCVRHRRTRHGGGHAGHPAGRAPITAIRSGWSRRATRCAADRAIWWWPAPSSPHPIRWRRRRRSWRRWKMHWRTAHNQG